MFGRHQDFPDIGQGSPEEESGWDDKSQTGCGDETPIVRVWDYIFVELKDQSEGNSSTDNTRNEHKESLPESDLGLVPAQLDKIEQADRAQKSWNNNV